MPDNTRHAKIIRASVLAISLVAAVLLILSYYMQSKDGGGTETEDFLRHLASSCADAVTDQMAKIEDISFQFIANRDLNQALSEYAGQEEKYQVSKSHIAFSNFLEGQAFTSSEIQNAFFWDYDEPAKKAIAMREGVSNDAMNLLRTSEFAASMRSAAGRTVWKKTSLTGRPGEDALLLGRIIKHTFTDSPMGFLVIVIDASSMVDTVKKVVDADLYYSIGTIKPDYLGLYEAKSGNVIAKTRGGSLEDDELKGIFGNLVAKLPIVGQDPAQSFVNRSVGGEDILFIVTDIGTTGWKLALPMALRSSMQLNIGKDGGYLMKIAVWLVTIVILLLVAGLFLRWTPTTGMTGRKAGETSVPDAASLGLLAPEGEGTLSDPQESAASSQAGSDRAFSNLTDKELRLLCLIAKGFSNKKIADAMCIAEQTVKNNVSALYIKLGVEDKVQASVYAVKMGIDCYDGEGSRGEES